MKLLSSDATVADRRSERFASRRSGLCAMTLAVAAFAVLGNARAATPPSTEAEQAVNKQPGDAAYAVQLKNAQALTTKAYTTNSREDYLRAAEAVGKCSSVHPEDLQLQRILADVYLNKLNQPVLALPHVQAVYAATPEAPGWGEMLAKSAGASGQTDLQIKVLREVANREPKNPWCRVELGKALAQSGQAAEADKAFQEAVALLQTDAYANPAYASFLRSQSRSTKAEFFVRKSLSIEPKSAAAMTLLGDIEQDNSDFTGAQANYSKALQINPSDSEAKAGLTRLEKSQSVQLTSSDYFFQGTDNFFQSGIYSTVSKPVMNHLYATAAFNTGWYHNNTSGLPSSNRYEEGVGLEYHPNSRFVFNAGVSAFEVAGDTQPGFNLTATWKANPKFYIYGSFRLHDTVTDSIYTVDNALSQNSVTVGSGYQPRKDLSSTTTISRASYSDGNIRNFIHTEPFTYTVWRPLQLRVGAAYELRDYKIATPNYSSPAAYQTYGPIVIVEPFLRRWLTFKTYYEATYVNESSEWGAIVTAGPTVYVKDVLKISGEYLYYNVPGSLTNYSGSGFHAGLMLRS
jgi:Flp pilus assembly protein TadD